MKRIMLLMLAAVLCLLTSCSSSGQKTDGNDTAKSYTKISQEEAREMMAKDDGHIVVDVRRQDEYDAGHIPEAILIYCRSGNRSKQAAQKLFDMGYTNIYEFGGINSWTGEIVTEG